MPRPDGRPYNFEKPQKVLVKVVEKPPPETELEVVEAKPAKRKGRAPHPLKSFKIDRRLTIKATPQLVAAACADIRGGLPIESALILQGISSQAMDKWRKANPSVDIAFKQAESDFEKRMVGHIERKAASDPKCAQWLLERRHSHAWAQTTKAELTGKNGAPIANLTLSKVLLGSVAASQDRARPVKTAKPKVVHGV